MYHMYIPKYKRRADVSVCNVIFLRMDVNLVSQHIFVSLNFFTQLFPNFSVVLFVSVAYSANTTRAAWCGSIRRGRNPISSVFHRCGLVHRERLRKLLTMSALFRKQSLMHHLNNYLKILIIKGAVHLR